MTKLELLYAEKAQKFDGICALVARELGYGELSTMNGEGRNQVEDEAEQYIEQWEETIEMRTSPPFARSRLYGVCSVSITTFAKEFSRSRKSRNFSGPTGEEPGVGVRRRPFNNGRGWETAGASASLESCCFVLG